MTRRASVESMLFRKITLCWRSLNTSNNMFVKTYAYQSLRRRLPDGVSSYVCGPFMKTCAFVFLRSNCSTLRLIIIIFVLNTLWWYGTIWRNTFMTTKTFSSAPKSSSLLAMEYKVYLLSSVASPTENGWLWGHQCTVKFRRLLMQVDGLCHFSFVHFSLV